MSKDSYSKGGDKGIGGGDKDKDKGLNHEYIVKKLIRYAKLREVSSSPLPKKKMTKFFTKTVGGSSALQLGGGWPCVFHGYFLSTLSMIQPQMMELFCKITLEFLESVSISSKGRGRTSFMGAARTGGALPPLMSDISSVPPSDANSSPSSSSVIPTSSSSSGSSPNSSASSATIVAASTSPPSSSSTSSPLNFVGGCSGFGGFIDKENEGSLTGNPSNYSTAASRLAADAEVLLEYLKTHKVDLVNSLIGLTPTMGFLEKHCPGTGFLPPFLPSFLSFLLPSFLVSSTSFFSSSFFLSSSFFFVPHPPLSHSSLLLPEMLLVQQRYREQARNTEESEQKRKQRELARLSRLSIRGGGLLSSSPTSRLPSPSVSVSASASASASASSLTSASASPSPPSSSPSFNQSSSQKAAHPLSSTSIQEMTKHSLLKLIQDWAKIDDAFHLQQQLKLFAEQLDDYTCSTLQVGDLVITCSQDLEILFGRILECRAVEGAFIGK
jgi:hypothetical protein